MKKTVFLFLFLVFIINAFGQKEIFSHLDKTKIRTGILVDMAYNWAKIEKFDGKTNNEVLTPATWRQIYFQLERSSLNKSFTDIVELKKSVNPYLRRGIFIVGVLNFEYNKIKDNALEKGLIEVKNGYIVEKANDIYYTKDVFAVSVINQRKTTGLNPVFWFSEDYFFTNKSKKIKYYLVDFNDGNAEQKILPGEKIQINYTTEGKKTIKVKAKFSDGTEKFSSFEFKAKDSSMPDPDYYWENFTADIPYNSEYAQGEVAIFLGKGNLLLKRPVIITDGFDPGDSRGIDALYDLANQQGMFDTLLARGYDAVLVNSYDGAGYIQKNAMLLVKVIDSLNNMLAINGNMLDANQIVTIAPSMAGLITRYALDYMEANNIPHNVRNYISFDSPQKGANIPIGLQHWVRFYADVVDNEGAQEAKAALDEPAAKEMLIYHYTATNGSTAAPNDLFYDFYSEINSMGFPQQPRLVSVINGNGYGEGQAYQPGEQVVEYEYESFLVDLKGNIWAEPDQSSHIVFEGLYNPIGWTNESENIYVDNTLPYDNAPGGEANTFEFLDQTETGGYGDIIAYYDDHCFIPTISSLCLQNVTDPMFDVDANRDNIVTPFDEIYYPAENQLHMTITQEMYNWFFFEIYNFKPRFTSTPITQVYEDEPYEYNISVKDSNYWNVLKVRVLEKPDWLNFDSVNFVLYGTPSNDNVGISHIKLSVFDGLDKNIQQFDINIINVNDIPYFTSSPITQAIEDQVYTYALTANDIDPTNDRLTFFVDQAPEWLQLSTQNVLFGTPANENVGSNMVKIGLTDGLDTVYQEFQIEVTNTNDAPYFTTTPPSIAVEDMNYIYTFDAEDIDPTNDSLIFEIKILPQWLTFDENNNISGTPTNEDVGFDSVSIMLTDGIDTVFQNFEIEVLNVNDPPFVNIPLKDTITAKDSLFVYEFSDSAFVDIDKEDILTYDAYLANGEMLPEWLSFDQENRKFSGIPTEENTYNIIVTATDLNNAQTFDGFELLVTKDGTAKLKETPINLKIYPNPTDGLVHIYTNNKEFSEYSLLSADGKILSNRKIKTDNTLIDISSLSSGIYYLKFTSTNNVKIIKIIKK